MYNLQTAITLRDNLFIQQIFMEYPYMSGIENAVVNMIDEVFVFIELTSSEGHIDFK